MTINLLPASDVDFNALVDAFNAAYQDYIVPIQMDTTAMQNLIRRDAIDLSASKIAVEGDQLVGILLSAIRDQRCWLAGLGVIPSHRQRGLGKRLMVETIKEAQSRGITDIKLEVIQGNTHAYMMYLALGFHVIRQLLILERDPFDPPQPEAYEIRSMPASEIIAYYDQFHSVPNPWQRELATLAALSDQISGIVALKGGNVVAYGVGWLHLDTIRWMDVAHAPGESEALRAVIVDTHHQNPHSRASLLNLGADDPAWKVMEALGYQPRLTQYEMVLKPEPV